MAEDIHLLSGADNHGRQDDKAAAASVHVTHTQQRHEAGGGRPERPFRGRFPIQIVLKKYNTAIFVNGCFWHGHSGCRHFVMPQTNRQFWQDKIERNIRRDAAVKTRLEALGWKVIVLWECELNTSARRKVTMGRLLASLKDNEAEYCAEQGRRKVLKALRRRENDEKKMRKGALEAEIHNRYDIPRKIVLDSENPALTDLCDF